MRNQSDKLLAQYPIISDQIDAAGLRLVLSNLCDVIAKNTAGDIVEFGCYSGTTSLFIRRLLDQTEQSKTRAFHVYDSFEGLPAKSRQDESAAGVQFAAGELAASKKQFLQNFRAANLAPPIAHKFWFDQLTTDDVPQNIAFAFLDGDFYESILHPLTLIWPRMSQGGIILIDDYGREALPGVERAVRDFFGASKQAPRFEHNIAIIKT